MSELKTTEALVQFAREYLLTAAQAVDTNPQTNSVFAFAGSEFEKLESETRSLSDLEAAVDHIHGELSDKRASVFRRQHNAPAAGDPWVRVNEQLSHLAAQNWDSFKSGVETARGGIVFTGHPTFARSVKMRQAFARRVEQPDVKSAEALLDAVSEDGREWSESITLAGEHQEIQAATQNVHVAMRDMAMRVIDQAKASFPSQWRSLRPVLPTVASWVGYDLDGRTDIEWWHSVALRLSEKAVQLIRYAEALEGFPCVDGVCADLAIRLRKAAAVADAQADMFRQDLSDPDLLIAAAQAISEEHKDAILSSSVVTDALTDVISNPDTPDELCRELMVLRAQVDALKLGTARIHLRVNAAQVRTVIQRDLDLDTENRELGRLALQKLSGKASEAPSRSINFAELFLEKSTAQRQFMMCALWLKYIDADSPIRFLIAEAENPATVMGALFLARQYGVEDKLDISPLFETPEALESGGRFISRLLDEPSFQDYLKKRGYLSIQLGFSDAGRFIGQVSANMAIERLHSLIIRTLSEKTNGVGLLIFNTHGESMGRGAYPGSFTDRLNHALTPWARAQAEARGIAIQHEVSFQGGDGILHFASPSLACSTYAHWCAHHFAPVESDLDDPFYLETDFVWDFYRSLRQWHERLFGRDDYARLLSDFATNFLVRAGSRQRRRASGPKGPRSLRAISHNATLQQLGMPINTAGGVGSSIRRETERLKSLIGRSDRMRHLVKLALHARMLTSIPVLRAYASVYDPSFWVAFSRYGDPDRAQTYRRVYYTLQDGDTFQSMNRMANLFSIDLAKFDDLLSELDDVPSNQERHDGRLDLHVLHGIRQALMMRALSIVCQLPRISRRHDLSLEDFIQMIVEMRLSDAAETIRQVFPLATARVEKLAALGTPADPHLQHGYAQIHEQIVEPLEDISRILHKSTLAIAEAYGAYG